MTGEAVLLDVRLAHWPSRMLAKLLDLMVQFISLFILVFVVGRIFDGADADTAAAVVVCIVVFVFVGYNVILETIWRGRTLGKAALGLRVVRDDGGPARFRHALVRGIMWPLEGWGPALIVSILNGRGKRLGDLLAGTIVVSERVPGQTA
ncbi:MAG TPA: RDD family protein, partial [Acidothermaceae bacterium]|nr:RDD family protein [Acidothermaceae bacterium]